MPLSSAPAATAFAVGPVLASSRPCTFGSPRNCVGQPGSVYVPATRLPPESYVWIAALNGQPRWFTQSDSTRLPLNGSYSHGLTSVSFGPVAATAMLANAKNVTMTAKIDRRMNPSPSEIPKTHPVRVLSGSFLKGRSVREALQGQNNARTPWSEG